MTEKITSLYFDFKALKEDDIIHRFQLSLEMDGYEEWLYTHELKAIQKNVDPGLFFLDLLTCASGNVFMNLPYASNIDLKFDSTSEFVHWFCGETGNVTTSVEEEAVLIQAILQCQTIHDRYESAARSGLFFQMEDIDTLKSEIVIFENYSAAGNDADPMNITRDITITL